MKPYRQPLVPWFLLTFMLTGVAGAQQTPSPTRPVLTVPRPDLSAMEGPARAKVESMQTTLAALVLRDDVRPSELAEAFGRLGQLYHAYRLLDSAEQCYSNSSKLAGNDYRWSYYLGLVHYSQGELETAVTDFERVLALRPDDVPTHVHLGNALLDLDRHDPARQRFERVLTLEAEHAAAIFGLARVASAKGDLQAAVGRFKRALELEPEASAIHYPLGQAYRQLGELDRAREHLEQRGDREIAFADPLGNKVARLAKGTAFDIVLSLAEAVDEVPDDEFLGFALSHFGDVKGSIEQLQNGLELERQSGASPLEQGRIHYVLGGLLVNDARDQDAIVQFQRAIELVPELIDARIKLGNALARTEQPDEALAAYDEVLRRQPRHAGALLKRAALRMGLGQDDGAREDLETLLELTPEASEVHVRLATLLEKEGDLEGALVRFRAASELEMAPQERPRVFYSLASLSRQRQRYDDAVSYYRRAIEADPSYVPALADLAGLMAQLGRLQEAAESYAAWVELEPENLPPRLAEATALILSDQHRKARERLEQALELHPDDVRVQSVLARHLAASPDGEVRDGARAVELALAAIAKAPTPEAAETVAMAYAQAGQLEQAVLWQRDLLNKLAEEQDIPEQLMERLRLNLSRYENGQPCCAD